MNTNHNADINIYQYNFIYHFRKQLPEAKVFYCLFIITKFFNVYLITHNIDNQSDNKTTVSITSWLRHIRLFPEDISNYKLDYSLFCIFIYVIVLILTAFAVIFYFMFKNAYLKSDQVLYRISSSKILLSSHCKLLLRCYVCFYYFVVFFSQFLIEVLGYAFFNVYYPTTSTSVFDAKQLVSMNSINSSLAFNKYIICALNSICIIFLLVYFYFFMLFSSYRTFTKSFGEKIVESHKQIMLMVIMFHLQGFYAISFFFIWDYGSNIRFFICCFMLCLLLINILLQFSYYNFSDNLIGFLWKFLSNVCLISAIGQVACFLLSIKRLNTIYEVYKFLFEIINGFFLTYAIVSYKKRKAVNEFFSNSLTERSNHQTINTSIIEYLALVNKACNDDKLAYNLLVFHITKHQLLCKTDTCYCRKYFKPPFTPLTTKGNIKPKKSAKTPLRKFKEIGEDQIVYSIITLSQNNVEIAKDFLLLHVDFLISIDKEYFLCLYLCQYYLSKKEKQLNFLYGYYIYEINRLIISLFKGRKLGQEEQKNSNVKKISVRFTKQTIVLNEQFRFHKIKSLLSFCLSNLEKVLFLKQMKNNRNKLIFKCNDVMKPLNALVKYRAMFFEHLTAYMNEDTRIENIEVSYIITYGLLLLFDHKVSRTFAKKYTLIKHFDSFSTAKTQFRNHFLILRLDNEDRFSIEYGSVKLIEKLLFKKKEFIGKDFNELMPAVILDYHSSYMKAFVSMTNVKLDKDTFLLSKKMNLIRVSASVRNLPSLSHLFSMIIQISTAKKDNKEDQIAYHLILDEYFNFISTTKRFEKQFFFTCKMLEVLKMNFSSFFGLNADNLRIQFKYRLMKDREALNKTYGVKKNLSLLTSVSPDSFDLYTYIVIKGRDRDKGFGKCIHNNCNSRDAGNKHNAYRHSNRLLRFEVNKSRTINGIKQIEKSIDELGLEKEWNERILFLYKRLGETKAKGDNGSKRNNFNFQFELKSIGMAFYYIVLITEEIGKYRYSIDTRSFVSMSPMNAAETTDYQTHGSIKFFSFAPNKQKLHHQSSIKQTINSSNNLINTISNSNSNIYHNNTKATAPKTPLAITPNMNMCNSNSNLNQSISNKSNFLFNNSRLHLFPQKDSGKFIDLNNQPSATKKMLGLRSKSNKDNNTDAKSKCSFDGRMLILKYVIYSLFITVFSLILALIITNYNCNKLSLSLYNVNSNAFLLKSDILFASLSIISSCFLKEGINTGDINLFTERIKQRADDILSHYHLMLVYVNDIITKSQADELYALLYSKEVYLLLATNWEYYERNATIGEEVYYMYYSLSQFDISDNDSKCRVKEYLYNRTYNPFPTKIDSQIKPGGDNDNDEKCTFEEQFLYYILANVISKLSSKMDDITLKTNELLNVYTSQSKILSLIVSGLVFAMAFVLYFILLYFIYFLFLKYRRNMENLFIYRPKEDSLLILVSNFKLLIDDFSKKDCIEFENKIKEISALGDQTYFNRQSQTLLNQLNMNSDKKPTDTKEIKRILMAQQKQSNDDSDYTEHQFRKIIQPLRLKVLICVIILFFIVFCCFQTVSIIISDDFFNDMTTQNTIAVNYLLRISKLAELELYAITSVLYENKNIIIKDSSDYSKGVLYNYYNIQIDLKGDSIFYTLNESNYAFIYYQLLVIRRNVQLFTYDKGLMNILPETRELEIVFNENEYFCIQMPYHFTLIETKATANDFKEVFSLMSRYTNECRTMGLGINLKGLDAAFDLMINELCALFTHYFLLNDAERNFEAFFTRREFEIVDQNLQLPFKKMQNVFADILVNEIGVFYTGRYFIELLFTLIAIFLSCGIIAIVISVINCTIEPYCNLAVEVKEMFENVLININEIGLTTKSDEKANRKKLME